MNQDKMLLKLEHNAENGTHSQWINEESEQVLSWRSVTLCYYISNSEIPSAIAFSFLTAIITIAAVISLTYVSLLVQIDP